MIRIIVAKTLSGRNQILFQFFTVMSVISVMSVMSVTSVMSIISKKPTYL